MSVPRSEFNEVRLSLADLVGKDLLLKIGEKRATYYILK